MRVIAGKFKGRKLVAPKGETRPTLDRTKETLFNILHNRLPQAIVLDLFAGSGQIGIECLSRGASRVVLCDNGRDAIVAIKHNFAQLKVQPELFCCHFADCIRRCVGTKFDIVFVDPPYLAGLYQQVFETLEGCQSVADDGIVVCEHSAEVDLPQQFGEFCCYDTRKIGSVKFSFYQRSQS